MLLLLLSTVSLVNVLSSYFNMVWALQKPLWSWSRSHRLWHSQNQMILTHKQVFRHRQIFIKFLCWSSLMHNLGKIKISYRYIITFSDILNMDVFWGITVLNISSVLQCWHRTARLAWSLPSKWNIVMCDQFKWLTVVLFVCLYSQINSFLLLTCFATSLWWWQ